MNEFKDGIADVVVGLTDSDMTMPMGVDQYDEVAPVPEISQIVSARTEAMHTEHIPAADLSAKEILPDDMPTVILTDQDEVTRVLPRVEAVASDTFEPSPFDRTTVMPPVSPPRRPLPTDKPDADDNKKMIIVALSLLCLALAGGLLYSLFADRTVPVDDTPEISESVTLRIPDVEGMTRTDAERVLTEAGFIVGKVTEDDSENVAQGNVIRQNPKAGAQFDEGTKVDLLISRGSNEPLPRTTVPNLNGMTLSEAKEVLAQANLVAVPGNPEFSNTVEAGQIFKQSPEAGSSVDEQTTVTFTAALGIETVVVPSVTGMTLADAASTLRDLGLNVDAHDEYSATIPSGSIVSQNPYAHVTCAKGTTVFLTVSKGPVPVGRVAVPDLTSLSLQQAIQIINSAGLTLDPVGTDMNGIVVSQNPAKDTMVDPGTRIRATFEPILVAY